MHAKCAAAVTQAAGRDLTKAELDGIENRVRAGMRAVARQDPAAWRSMTEAERVQAGAEWARQQLEAEANLDKARKQLQIAKHIETTDRIQEVLFADPERAYAKRAREKAVKADIERTYELAGGIKADYMRQTMDAIEAMKHGQNFLARAFDIDNPAMERDIIREIYRGADGSTGNEVAKAAAQQIGATSNAMRERFNRAGGNVGQLDYGYRAIHFVGRIASVVGVVAFVYMFAQLFAHHDVGALLANRHFSLASFLLSMSLSASWQIAFGPYVADYSRYLPRSTSSVGTFVAVGLGSVIGAQAAMVFGVFAAALAGSRFAHHEVSYIVGLGSTGAVAALLYFSIAFGKVTVTALNAYGSFMSMATIVSGFRGKQAVSSRSRLVYIFGMICVSTLIALAGRHSFLKEFTAFILFLLAFFTPWSAINLVDYYCFTRSRYDVPALSDPDGRYGRWNAMAIAIYVIGILVQLPFMSTHIYTGPLVDALGGTDISWILGLVVPAALYYIGARASRRSIPERLILPLERGELPH